MKTLIYTAEVTEVVSDGVFDADVPKMYLHRYENGELKRVQEVVDDDVLAMLVKEKLDVDDVVITKVQVFETDER